MAATRGRPRKNPINTIESTSIVPEESIQFQENYVQNFAKAMSSIADGGLFMNPVWRNQILKDINMSPNKYDRDKVKKLLADPKNNEKALSDLSQFLSNYIMQYKRIVNYMSELLTFNWYLEPTNADREDMSGNVYKKAWKKAVNFMNDFDPKLNFPQIVESMIMEDGKFYYKRESENGIYMQEMPKEYCKIWAKTDLGYQYAFNLTYFLRTGINFDDYAPEFKEYYNAFVNGDEYVKNKDNFKANRYFYWQTLSPEKAWVFKYDQTHAGMSPPLMGLFLDAIEIVNYKELLKAKTNLDVWRLLIAKIPMHKDGTGKSGNMNNNFAITADQAGKFQQLMQDAVQQGVKVVATPLETEAIDLKGSENKDSIVGVGNQEFWATSGTTSAMFGEKKLTGSGVDASIKTDEMFVTGLYRQFERFYNYQLKLVTGKFRFKCHLEGTKMDREERMDLAMQLLPYGAPITYVAAASGRSLQEFVNLLEHENSMGLHDIMTPWLTSHTISDNGKGGAPTKRKIKDSTEVTQDHESNQNR